MRQISQRECGWLKNLGAALQGDGETRSPGFKSLKHFGCKSHAGHSNLIPGGALAFHAGTGVANVQRTVMSQLRAQNADQPDIDA
jgi:hypothetical protein